MSKVRKAVERNTINDFRFGLGIEMNLFEQLKALTSPQRSAILASFLGWTLDAFDFFILVFVIKDIAKEFHTDVKSVTITLFLTLAMRPLGAFLFGVIADRFGRRIRSRLKLPGPAACRSRRRAPARRSRCDCS